MTTQREMSKINRLLQIILREGSISKIRLVMQSGISISYYEKLKPFLEELHQYKVRYDRNTRTWYALTQEEVNDLSS